MVHASLSTLGLLKLVQLFDLLYKNYIYRYEIIIDLIGVFHNIIIEISFVKVEMDFFEDSRSSGGPINQSQVAREINI